MDVSSGIYTVTVTTIAAVKQGTYVVSQPQHRVCTGNGSAKTPAACGGLGSITVT